MNNQVDGGPKLLLDWRQPGEAAGMLRAGGASLLLNVLLFGLLSFLAGVQGRPAATAPEIESNLHKVAALVAPPLTQKAPNRGRVSKEVDVEDLLPRPASQERLPPAPAPRKFKAPAPKLPRMPQPGAPRLAEPPKIEAQLNAPPAPPPAGANTSVKVPPPQIQAGEKPRLAFETPGQNGSSAQKNPALGKIEPPKMGVDEAIRGVARGGGQGGLAVGDLDPVPNLPESPRLTPAPGKTGSSLELLSDPMGVDFKPYLIRVLSMVRRNWFAVIPESAHLGRRGVVLLQFVIDRSGQVPKLVIASPSGAEALDRAAVAGVSASVPFPPLPSEYKGRDIRLQFAFKYNVR